MRNIILVLLVTATAASSFAEDESVYAFPEEYGQTVRSDFVRPFVSYFLPGFSQWMGDQYGYGLAYSALGVIGMNEVSGAASASVRNDDKDSLTPNDDVLRRALIGEAMYKVAGGMSAYHAFRSAVITRREQGQYAFLPKETESPLDLALAPFNFKYIVRPTTFTPLLLLIGLGIGLDKERYHWANFELDEMALTSGISYGAGVGEETSFRGFLLPVSQEYMGRFWLANSTQSIIFGAAHLGPRNPFPIMQTLAGYYFGWLHRKRDWQLGENIFLHTWWDVVAIAMDFAAKGKTEFIPLPRFEMTF